MPVQTKEPQRIAKLLARAGVASRREVERMIADGRVARDGTVIDTPATVLTSLHGVTVDGQPVRAPDPARLFAFHKPAGFLVTERDPKGRPTIYDRLPRDLPRVVPVGRLDLATEGLLLLTTDGGLKRQLELPANGVERAYRARAYGQISQAQLEELAEGVEIDGVRYGSIDANLERRTGANVWIELVLTEGKNREVRRVLEYLGLQVSRLIRTRYGPWELGEMPAGAVGEIRQHDLVAFRKSLTLPPARRDTAARITVEAGVRPQRSHAPAPAAGDRPKRGPARPAGAAPGRGGAAPKPARPKRDGAFVRSKSTDSTETGQRETPARPPRAANGAPASRDTPRPRSRKPGRPPRRDR